MVSFPMAKLIFVVVLGLISASEQCQNFCPEGWKGFNDRCFKFFPQRWDWVQAELFCVALGGNLASVHSAEEDQFLKDICKAEGNPSYLYYWIGLTGSPKRGTWMWSDGSKLDIQRWHKGQPNNSGNHDCVYTGATHMWDDGDCGGNRFSFICVRRSVPAVKV